MFQLGPFDRYTVRKTVDNQRGLVSTTKSILTLTKASLVSSEMSEIGTKGRDIILQYVLLFPEISVV